MSSVNLFYILLISGLLLSMNPASISVMTSLMSGAIGKGYSRRKQSLIALVYMSTFFAFFVISGLALANVIQQLPTNLIKYVGVFVSGFAIIWSIIKIKDYYFKTTKNKIPRITHKTLHYRTVKNNSPPSAVVLGVTSGFASLPSAGLALALVTLLLTLNHSDKLILNLSIFAFALLASQIIIFILCIKKFKMSVILKWRADNQPVMDLTIGLITIFLSWLILLVINGSIRSF